MSFGQIITNKPAGSLATLTNVSNIVSDSISSLKPCAIFYSNDGGTDLSNDSTDVYLDRCGEVSLFLNLTSGASSNLIANFNNPGDEDLGKTITITALDEDATWNIQVDGLFPQGENIISNYTLRNGEVIILSAQETDLGNRWVFTKWGTGVQVFTGVVADTATYTDADEGSVLLIGSAPIDSIFYKGADTWTLAVGGIDLATVQGVVSDSNLYYKTTALFKTAAASRTFTNGETVRIGDTGLSYRIQADSVQYYVTDDSLVIDLGTNYAVADLSKKRQFVTLDDFKIYAPLLTLKDGEFIDIGNGKQRWEVAFSPKRISTNTSLTTFVNPDGVFIDTIYVNFDGENLMRVSEYVSEETGDPPYVIVTGSLDQNVGIAPNGTKSADRTIYPMGTFFCDVAGSYITPSTTYTISFFAKLSGGTGRKINNIQLDTYSGTRPSITFNNDNQWHRYSAVVTTSATPTTFNYWYGGFASFASTDTLYLWGFQIEEGSVLTEYKRVDYKQIARSGKAYIYRTDLIEGKTLRLDKIVDLSRSYTSESDDTELLRKAIAFCDEGKVCNQIKISGIWTIKDTILMSNMVQIVGDKKTYEDVVQSGQSISQDGATIILAIPDSTKSAFVFRPYGSYVTISGSGIEGVTIVARDTIGRVFYMLEAFNCFLKNVEVYSESGGKVKSGLFVDTGSPSNSLNNNFSGVTIRGAGIGIQYEGSAFNDFKNVSLLASDTSLYITNGASVTFDGISVEDSNNGLIMTGGTARIIGIYSESVSQNAIKQSGGNLMIFNAILQVSESTDTLLNLSGGSVKIENSVIRTPGEVYVSDQFGSLYVENVATEVDFLDVPMPVNVKRNLNIVNQYDYNSGTRYRGMLSKMSVESGVIGGSVIENSSFGDTVSLREIWDVRQNYITNSDSFPVGKFGGADSIFVTKAATLDPYGGTEAQIVKYIGVGGTSGSSASYATFTSDSSGWNVGDEWTFSFFVKPYFNRKCDLMAVRPFQSTGTNISFYAPEGEWTRVFISDTIRTKTTNTIELRLTNSAVNSGDSLAVFGMQFEKGGVYRQYTSTSSTVVDAKTRIIEIGEDGNVTVNTSLLVDGSTQDVTIDATGYMGVNSATPSFPLDVNGEAGFGNVSAGNLILVQPNATVSGSKRPIITGRDSSTQVNGASIAFENGGIEFRGNVNYSATANMVVDSNGAAKIRENLSTESTTDSTQAVLFKITLMNTTSGALAVKAPASPVAGDWFAVSDSRGQAGANNITVAFVAASQNLHGSSQNHVISTNKGFVKFVYVNSTVGWVIAN